MFSLLLTLSLAYTPQTQDVQTRAAKLLAGSGEISRPNLDALKALGSDAFQPIFDSFLTTCSAYDKAGKSTNSYPLYSRLHDLGQILVGITTKERVPLIEATLDRKPKIDSAGFVLLQMLAKAGDPREVTPYFIREIEGVKTPGFEMYDSSTYVARDYIIHSRDPRAAAFLLKNLRNPKGDFVLKEEAYWHLANTGNEGLEAVLAERHKRTFLRPLDQRVISGILNAGEFGTRTKVLAMHKSKAGKSWGLLRSGVLGSAGDLWLAEQVNGKWVHPLFTGVSTDGISRWVKSKPPEPTIGGKHAAELVKGAWFDVLASNREIRRDSDHDGLTDLVEKRLGTNPRQADTDRDGIPDGTDPFPNARPRSLSDTEQVLQAAFEARYHFDTSEGPALVYLPASMKPFEMVGRSGPTLCAAEHEGFSLPLEQCYEQGIAFVRFSGDDRKGSDMVSWNKDRTEARLIISTYFGGLNGTGYRAIVRKFGNDWVVVSMDMAYVS